MFNIGLFLFPLLSLAAVHPALKSLEPPHGTESLQVSPCYDQAIKKLSMDCYKMDSDNKLRFTWEIYKCFGELTGRDIPECNEKDIRKCTSQLKDDGLMTFQNLLARYEEVCFLEKGARSQRKMSQLVNRVQEISTELKILARKNQRRAEEIPSKNWIRQKMKRETLATAQTINSLTHAIDGISGNYTLIDRTGEWPFVPELFLGIVETIFGPFGGLFHFCQVFVLESVFFGVLYSLTQHIRFHEIRSTIFPVYVFCVIVEVILALVFSLKSLVKMGFRLLILFCLGYLFAFTWQNYPKIEQRMVEAKLGETKTLYERIQALRTPIREQLAAKLKAEPHAPEMPIILENPAREDEHNS